ncbi:MAG: hypothetical protein MJZ96_04320, partial [Paludibacteraceae bacterium]|nr:hypothetical protein [Paludibacteraceae bacterium]
PFPFPFSFPFPFPFPFPLSFPFPFSLKLNVAFEAYEATFPKKEKKQQEGQLVDDCTKNPTEQ